MDGPAQTGAALSSLPGRRKSGKRGKMYIGMERRLKEKREGGK